MEQAWIDKVGPILNHSKAWVSEEEALKTKHAGQKRCYENRKEHYKGKANDYYNNNKEKVLKRMKERTENDEEFKKQLQFHAGWGLLRFTFTLSQANPKLRET